jgi:hypothetical protein
MLAAKTAKITSPPPLLPAKPKINWFPCLEQTVVVWSEDASLTAHSLSLGLWMGEGHEMK